MIRVAVLSFWHVHGKDYARDATEHPDTELVAIWDEVPERGRAEAEQRGVRFYENLDDLLAQPDIDAVVVTTPTNIHREVMVAAARAGKHIFTEKLIAASSRDAEEIVRAAQEAGIAFMVSLRRVADAATQRAKEIVDSGALGELTLVRVRESHSGSLPNERAPRGFLPEWFYDREQAQGGVLTDLCHPVYVLRHLLGRPQSVSATFGFFTGRAVEDNAAITLRYPNGAIGIAETAFVAYASPYSLEVQGTRGCLLYSETGIGEYVARGRGTYDATNNQPHAGPDGQLRILDADHMGWRLEDPGQGLPTAFEQWVTQIQDGTRPTLYTELGLELTAIVEAANLSDATGTRVDLDPPAAEAPLPPPM